MSFFYCINWSSFFSVSVSVTVSVIFYFSVTVIVTVNLIIFFSYFAISVTVTVNLNNTVCNSIESGPWIFQTPFIQTLLYVIYRGMFLTVASIPGEFQVPAEFGVDRTHDAVSYRVSALLCAFEHKVLWYNAIIAVSPKSEVCTGQGQVLDTLRHSDSDLKLCDGFQLTAWCICIYGLHT